MDLGAYQITAPLGAGGMGEVYRAHDRKWRITKEGFAPAERAAYSLGSLQFRLSPAADTPPGMVPVVGGPVASRGFPAVTVDDFWLGTFEVTNQDYKRFVDAGGYSTPKYWTNPIAKGEVVVPLGGGGIARGAPKEFVEPQRSAYETRRTHMTWHPLDLLRVIFGVLVCVTVVAGLTTSARPRTPRQWTLVWAVFVFLTWALLGFGWLRA